MSSEQEESAAASATTVTTTPAKDIVETESQQKVEPHPIISHIEKALAHKQRGNEFVAQKDWKKASFEYKHIPLYLSQYVQNSANKTKGDDDSNSGMVNMFSKAKKPRTKEEYEIIASTLYAAHCNLSLVHLNLGRVTNALQSAQSAVDLNDENVKGYYRRARARLALGMPEEAAVDFNKVLSVTPDDAASKAGLQEVQMALAKAKEKEQKMFKKMFA